MSDLEIIRPRKIPQSLFAKNFLNYWSAEFAKTDRVTAEELESDLETFSKMLEASFQTETALNQAAELLLKLFSLSHKTNQTAKWLDIAPLIVNETYADKLDANIRVRLLNRMGQTYRIQHRSDEAFRLHLQALNICKEGLAQDSLCWADCYYHLAEFYTETHQPQTALTYNSALINLPDFDTFPASFRATTLNSSGLIHLALNRTQEALKHYQAAADIWQSEGDDVEQIRTLLNIGFAWLKIEESEKARDTFQFALQLSEKYPYKKILVLNNIGILNFEDDQFQEAIENWEEGVKVSADLEQQPKVLSEIFHNLGYVHQQLKLYEVAVSYYNRASIASRERSNSFDNARAIGGKAEAYFDWGKVEESIELFDRAIATLGDVSADNWLLQELQAGRALAHKKINTVTHPSK